MYLAEKDHPLTVNVPYRKPFVPDSDFVLHIVNYCNRNRCTWVEDYSTASGIVYWLLMAGF